MRPPAPGHIGTQKPEHADNSLLTVELLLLVVFVVGMLSSTAAHQQAIALLLTGPYAAPFWMLVVGCGILLPLTLQFLQAQHRIHRTVMPAILVIIGGLMLRVISWPRARPAPGPSPRTEIKRHPPCPTPSHHPAFHVRT